MKECYTNEENILILIALMKEHGVKRVVVSPGTTNLTFIMSLQNDEFFVLFSAADERQAAYIACGLAAETKEPVALSCTGATASRNYIPALTEAFYRKLPILAITSTQHEGRIGHHIPQVIDRSSPLNDICLMSKHLGIIHSNDDRWACTMDANEALLELRHRGGGPVHINLATTYSRDYSIQELPQVRVVKRFEASGNLPIPPRGTIAIFVGAHLSWGDQLTQAVDAFCENNNAVVLCDHSSNYYGKYRIEGNLVTDQEFCNLPCKQIDLLIHIGEISGAYMAIKPTAVWRVSPDGKLRDTFGGLTSIFEMSEIEFFERYNKEYAQSVSGMSYWRAWKDSDAKLRSCIPELPFSNAWIAMNALDRLPANTVVYLGILNTLRAWNYFLAPRKKNLLFLVNTGGFGIDGYVSSLLGSALADDERLHLGVIGDLAFFYDMNALGNRHLPRNLRLIIINNGRGTEFRNYFHTGAQFGDRADEFIAAAGHYGDQSPALVRHYAEDLGMEYYAIEDKEQFTKALEAFLQHNKKSRPKVMEIFTNWQDESDALFALRHIGRDANTVLKNKVKGVLGEKGVRLMKRFTSI